MEVSRFELFILCQDQGETDFFVALNLPSRTHKRSINYTMTVVKATGNANNNNLCALETSTIIIAHNSDFLMCQM